MTGVIDGVEKGSRFGPEDRTEAFRCQPDDHEIGLVKVLLSFGLAFEESLRWPTSYAKLRTSLYTSLAWQKGETTINEVLEAINAERKDKPKRATVKNIARLA